MPGEKHADGVATVLGVEISPSLGIACLAGGNEFFDVTHDCSDSDSSSGSG